MQPVGGSNRRAESATERAYAHTKARILDGTYAGGELITEGGVAEEVGVSRTPVREAFLRLEAEALLRLYPKRGALVIPVSAKEIDDVIETRQMIERFAIDKIITGGRHPEVGETLRDAVARQARLLGSAAQFTARDRDFHGLLVEATGNALLTRIYNGLRDRQLRMGVTALKYNPWRADEIIEEHRVLADAIAGGDRVTALDCITRHLEGTESILRNNRNLASPDNA
jgi:DNA-binding GntR family transcriptional regulator